ncbi:MAG TPA: DUF3037 domain-containing protein [Streptosporangiaceae bacterium]|nr:DUF3037 domain-containing protein [Streptosporangiaceae bacterium]
MTALPLIMTAACTVVQAGPVHTGLTRDPEAEIERLLQALVLRPR